MPRKSFSSVARVLVAAPCLLAAAILRLGAAEGGESSTLASSIVGLMSNVAQLAKSGEFKAVADLSRANPAIAVEILATGLQNAGSNRGGMIETVLNRNPDQRVTLATAVATTTTPAQFQSEVPALLVGLTPAQMVGVATKALPKNPSIAAIISSELGLRSGVPQAKLASLLVAANPNAAANIASGLMLSVTGVSNEALAVAYASIAAAAASKAPSQAAAIAASPIAVGIAAILNSSPLQITFAATVASAVARVVPSQAAAITKAVLESYPSSWLSNFPDTSLAIVNAVAHAVPADQRPAIAAAAETAAKGRQDASRFQISYLEATQLQPFTSTGPLAERAIADAKAAVAMPLPSSVSSPASSGSTAPAKNTPPFTPPVDPTANVSRSS